jgi:hypothetical protein
MAKKMSNRAAHLTQYQFKPGTTPNPKGKAAGTRDRLGRKFIADLLRAYEEPVVLTDSEGRPRLDAEGKPIVVTGFDGLVELRMTKPEVFYNLMVRLVPQHLIHERDDGPTLLDALAVLDEKKTIEQVLGEEDGEEETGGIDGANGGGPRGAPSPRY